MNMPAWPAAWPPPYPASGRARSPRVNPALGPAAFCTPSARSISSLTPQRSLTCQSPASAPPSVSVKARQAPRPLPFEKPSMPIASTQNWSLQCLTDQNPFLWMLDIDGFIVDIRNAPDKSNSSPWPTTSFPTSRTTSRSGPDTPIALKGRHGRHQFSRQRQKTLTRLPSPVRKLMRSEIIKTRNINNPRTGLKALRDNPRLQIIRPSPVSTTSLDNFASPNKSLTIRHAKSPALAENLRAETSMFRNTRNQWDVGGAYATG